MIKIEANGYSVYEYVTGHKEWFFKGERHRLDGPAIEYPSGVKKWFKNGLRHREDGPAVEHTGGYQEWWLNHIQYTQEEFVLLQFTKGIIINDQN